MIALPILAAEDLDALVHTFVELPEFLFRIAADPLGFLAEGGAWTLVAPLLIAASQTIFLLPLARPPVEGGSRRRLLGSAIMAAAIGGMMAAALVFALLEVISWDLEAAEALGGWTFGLAPLAALVVGWTLWARVLLRRGSAADPLCLDRMFLPLVKGTVVATALLVPMDAMVRRKRDCYCLSGSFFGICLGLAALVWLLGPWIVLALSRGRRRALRRRVCLACGYPRVGRVGRGCPECGRGRGQGGSPHAAASS